MLKITPAAAEQIQAEIDRQGADTLALRIAAQVGSDRSIKYMVGFDEVKADETPVMISNIKVLMDDATQQLLEETEIDFVELEPNEFQFIFKNPLDPNYVAPKS